MKTRLIILSLLLHSLSGFAGNWVAESELGQEGADVYIRSQGQCTSVKGERCWDITDKPTTTHSIQQVREGEWQAAVSVEACVDEPPEVGCTNELAAKVCPDGTYSAFAGDLDEDGNPETWCARRALVKVYREDAAKKAAYESALDQLRADNEQLFNDGRACLQLHRQGTPSNAQLVGCQRTILELLKYQFQNQ